MVRATIFRTTKHFGSVPTADDIEKVEQDLPPLKNGEVLFQAEYLSVDPFQKVLMPFVPVGTVMIGEQVARVVESKNPKYPIGREYLIACGWRSHTVFNPDNMDEVDWKPFYTKRHFMPLHHGLKGLTPSLALGTVGMPGATAFIAVVNKLDVQPGKTIFINAASGAVGQVAGQIAKIKGCKVIGTAGTKDKCDFLKKAGFDIVFNYKTDNLDTALSEAAPDGLDYYVDQVGGTFSNTVVGKHMADFGRIVVIGSMSEHANSKFDGIPWSTYTAKQLTLMGMVIFSRPDPEWNQAFDNITTWIKEGRLSYKEDITQGFGNAVKAFISLFSGQNSGKAIVKA